MCDASAASFSDVPSASASAASASAASASAASASAAPDFALASASDFASASASAASLGDQAAATSATAMTEAEQAEKLRELIKQVTTAQDPDTPRHLFKVTIPHLRNLLGKILDAITEMQANAAKARVDLAARKAEVVAKDGPSDKIDADAESLAQQIDAAEARKKAALESEAVNAENALEKLTQMVAEAEEALAAYDAAHPKPTAA